MKLCLVYPHQYIFHRPINQKGLTTIDIASGGGWQNAVISNPYDVESTVEKIISTNPYRVLALSEEAVVPVALANEKLKIPGLTVEAARNSVNKINLREALPERLNPQWESWRFKTGTFHTDRQFPLVLKSPSSWLSLGVKKISFEDEANDWCDQLLKQSYVCIDRAERLGNYFHNTLLVEEYIEGEQYCVSGIVANKGRIIHQFPVIKQTWDSDREMITKYEKCSDNSIEKELNDIAKQAVRDLGFSWCGYNFGIKGELGEWKIIDAHSRLGEDSGNYNELLGDKERDPTMLMIDLLGE